MTSPDPCPKSHIVDDRLMVCTLPEGHEGRHDWWAGSPLTAKQHERMLEVRDKLRVAITKSLIQHGSSGARMPLVFRDVRMRAEALAARYHAFHVDEDDLRELDRRALGHSDYADKFPLYIAQRMWGII